MSVDELPTLSLPQFGDICDPARPVLSYAWEAGEAHRAAAHSHPRAHIIYPEAGDYWVETTEGTWRVPAGQAIWIPPRVHHLVYSHGPVSASVLFVDPAHAGSLPTRCGTVEVTEMLQALLHRTVGYGNAYLANSPAARLAVVMLDELATMEFAPVLLPIAKDPRLARVMRRLIEEPELQDSFEELAREAAASPRTLARLFRSETGMTFTRWRTNLLLMEAMARLTRGETVTQVATDLGYQSTSSFVYMFRRNLGVSPGQYRARAPSDPPGVAPSTP